MADDTTTQRKKPIAAPANTPPSSGYLSKIVVVVLVGWLAWGANKALRPPPPKLCGTPGGPPVTAPRIKLRDGRHLAYKLSGVPLNESKHSFIFIHGFDSCRHSAFIATHVSPETINTLGLHIVALDRPGYGESDPHPKRTPKSIALDIQELADQLGLPSKFYLVGFSMGGQVAWGCLKYIPRRLAGVSLITPVVNYWWSGLPSNLSTQAYNLQLPPDLWTARVAHYAPWLIYWWQTQKLFPPSNVITRNRDIFSSEDRQIILAFKNRDKVTARQQGDYESLHRDLKVGFGRWEFCPTELENPFPNKEGTVHLWQGDEDGLVPVLLQRYIAQRLPWIHYHELPGSGHLFPYLEEMSEAIIRAQLSLED